MLQKRKNRSIKKKRGGVHPNPRAIYDNKGRITGIAPSTPPSLVRRPREYDRSMQPDADSSDESEESDESYVDSYDQNLDDTQRRLDFNVGGKKSQRKAIRKSAKKARKATRKSAKKTRKATRKSAKRVRKTSRSKRAGNPDRMMRQQVAPLSVDDRGIDERSKQCSKVCKEKHRASHIMKGFSKCDYAPFIPSDRSRDHRDFKETPSWWKKETIQPSVNHKPNKYCECKMECMNKKTVGGKSRKSRKSRK